LKPDPNAKSAEVTNLNYNRQGAKPVAIKVIVELQAKPGKRNELKNLIAGAIPTFGPMPGFLGSTLNEVIDDPDMLVEIAEWESAEARMALMEKVMETDFFTSIGDLLAGPFKATVVRQLP
jgi:quinol monooxygenase YgiN